VQEFRRFVEALCFDETEIGFPITPDVAQDSCLRRANGMGATGAR
jgi:hypothetical protein